MSQDRRRCERPLPLITALDRAEVVPSGATECHGNQWSENWAEATDPGIGEVKSPCSQRGPGWSLGGGSVCGRQLLYKKNSVFLV